MDTSRAKHEITVGLDEEAADELRNAFERNDESLAKWFAPFVVRNLRFEPIETAAHAPQATDREPLPRQGMDTAFAAKSNALLDMANVTNSHSPHPKQNWRHNMESFRTHRGMYVYEGDRPIGEGAYGEVFEGYREDSEGRRHKVAVKRIRKGCEREAAPEIRCAQNLTGHGYKFVIPILDVGRTNTGHQCIVMARAEIDLQQHLEAFLHENSRNLELERSIDILNDVSRGIREIGQDNRLDLKPSNVLYHDGSWKLSDIGAHARTDAYAAPELWRNEEPSSESYIYSLGCMMYSLITGLPPFDGPDLRRQHLEEIPPVLEASNKLALLALICLKKQPAGRPRIRRVIELLRLARNPDEKLSKADLLTELAQQREERDATRSIRNEARRQKLASGSVKNVRRMLTGLVDRILHSAENAESNDDGREVKFGDGKLDWDVLFPQIDADQFTDTGWDVCAGAMIRVASRQASYSANLWYADVDGSGEYRWWEISYALGRGHEPRRDNEFSQRFHVESLPIEEGRYIHASPGEPIDGEFCEEFYRRWQDLLADAVIGDLRPVELGQGAAK